MYTGMNFNLFFNFVRQILLHPTTAVCHDEVFASKEKEGGAAWGVESVKALAEKRICCDRK